MSKPQIVNIDISYVLLNNNRGQKITLVLLYRPPNQRVQTDSEIYEQIAEITDDIFEVAKQRRMERVREQHKLFEDKINTKNGYY